MDQALTKLIGELQSAARKEPITVDGEIFALVPEGMHLQNMSEKTDALRRVIAAVTLFDVDSFAEYWGRFEKEAESVCFADLEALRVTSVIDYHHPDGKPAHCDHIAKFMPRKSVPWAFWRTIAGKFMSQKDFQRVLEERHAEVVSPGGASLLELIANLEATMKIEAGNVERLDNGSRKISYSKNNEIKGGVVIPPSLGLRLPIFESGEAVEITVLLRWDVNEETHKAQFKVDIPNITEIEQFAFGRLCNPIAELIGDRFYWGAAGL